MRNLLKSTLCGLALAIGSMVSAAGVPEPSLLVYGQVKFTNGVWTQGGTATITLTPVGGGTAVVIAGEVKSLASAANLYSYQAKFPVESVLAGQTISDNTLLRSAAAVQYDYSAAFHISTQDKTITGQTTISPDQFRGGSVRLDVDFGTAPPATPTPTSPPTPTPTPPPPPTPIPTQTPYPNGTCPGDANRDGTINNNDYHDTKNNFGVLYQSTPPAQAIGDANLDTAVNMADYRAILDFFGSDCVPGGIPPDPDPVNVTGARRPRLFVSPATRQVSPGSSFTMDVRLDPNGYPAAAAGVFVHYDPVQLQFLGAAPWDGATTATLNADLTAKPLERQPGVISFPAVALAPIASEVTLARMNFRALAAAGTQSHISFLSEALRPTRIETINFDEITSLTEEGIVTIANDPRPRLFITPSTQFAEGSTPYTVDVRMDLNASTSKSVVGWVTFDPSVTSFTSGTVNSTLFTDGFASHAPALQAPGVVTFTATSSTTVTGNDVLVAHMVFAPAAAGSTAITLDSSTQHPTRVLDTNFNNLQAVLASGFVTLEDFATPTPAPTPTSTPVPTTATPSLTPIPTTPPTSAPNTIPIVFQFNAGSEGWSFVAPTTFNAPLGTVTGTSLGIVTSENHNTFGFWESPLLLSSAAPANSLIIAHYVVSSNISDATKVPTIRLRASTTSFQRSDVVVATSTNNAAFSPDSAGHTYDQFFPASALETQVRMDFDVLNADPSDAANATMLLDAVTLEIAGALTGQRDELTLDFTTSQNSWTSVTASPFRAPAMNYVAGQGLEISGGAATTDTTTLFGFWGSPSATPYLSLERGRLYRLDYTVASNATLSNRAGSPTFRLRMNDETFRAAAYVNIEPLGSSTMAPLAGSPRTYSLWFEAPNGFAGNGVVLSFDYLLQPALIGNPAISITLSGVVVKSYNEP